MTRILTGSNALSCTPAEKKSLNSANSKNETYYQKSETLKVIKIDMNFPKIAKFLNTDNNEKLLSDFHKTWQHFLYCQLIQKTI
eukprot:Pgem_evm1s910